MKQRKPNPRLLCCASIFVLSLTGCSQHAGKLKHETDLNENVPPESASSTKKSRIFHISKNSFRSKGLSAVAEAGKNARGYHNLWERLFDLYNLPRVEHEDIDRELGWFINHPDYIDRVQERARPFLYTIVRQVEKHDVPGEIALLPVIESAFKPEALSPAKAAGLWQFIPSTGRLYGLKQTRSYDGRRDVYASTRAAIKYLKKLHADFNGDWLLAVAAYNCGEGTIARAIQKNEARNRPTDFWSLDLPQETRTYVPRLLAVAKLFAGADQYGIDLHDIPNQALFKTVKIDSQLDLALAADAADISLDELYELNPGFKHRYTSLDGSYRLFIPARKKIRAFKEELARLAEERSSSGKTRSIAASEKNWGDDEEVVATSEETFSSRVKDTVRTADRSASTGKARESYRAYPRVIPRIRDELSVRTIADPTGTTDKSGKKSAYVVQDGDTLWSIAQKNAIDVEQLAKWNHLSNNTSIKTGQSLVVWSKDAAKKLPIAKTGAGFKPSQSIKYTVREGDSLFGISKRFNVSVADLRKWNGMKVDKHFKPGLNLTVSGEKEKPFKPGLNLTVSDEKD
jgi:membrane-bound lytic murein transglycosylase D